MILSLMDFLYGAEHGQMDMSQACQWKDFLFLFPRKNDTLSLLFSLAQLLGFLWSGSSTGDRVLWHGLLLKSNYSHINICAFSSIHHIQNSVLIVSQFSSINMKNEAIQMQPLGQSTAVILAFIAFCKDWFLCTFTGLLCHKQLYIIQNVHASGPAEVRLFWHSAAQAIKM